MAYLVLHPNISPTRPKMQFYYNLAIQFIHSFADSSIYIVNIYCMSVKCQALG